jgi:SNF2 family DNA or RNA helicase
MVQCHICYAWQPKDWQGWKWADTVARCSCKDKFTTYNETCEQGSITGKVQKAVYTKPKQQITFEPELFQHQIDDLDRYKDETIIAPFWEMGCGKSALILRIAAYKFRKGEINALLIIAPNDVHVQWAKEQVPLWLDCPYDIQCLFGRGGAKQAFPFDTDSDLLQVVCVNIDTFSTTNKWKEIADWANIMKTFIVLDEATTIKNVNAKRTQNILYGFNNVIKKGKTILQSIPRSKVRAILTGTPVTNGPMDLWAMCEFLKPNYFERNWYSFQGHYGMFTSLGVGDRVIKVPINEDTWHAIKAIKEYNEANCVFGISLDTYNVIQKQDHFEGPYKNADELKEKLKPIASFKLLKDCIDMPPQIYNTRILEMSPEQRYCYDSMVDEYIAEYNEHTATALNKMTAIIRLQQISSGFICDKSFVKEDTDDIDIMPDEIEWIGTSNPKLDALYRDVNEMSKPIVIITRFSAEAARIYADLSRSLSCCLMTGWKRVGTLDEFKEGKYDVMIANIAVIARGFNLQNSHVMPFYSNTFSLELRLQAEGRIFRINQKETCEYIDYTFNNSIDEKIVGALKMKRNLLDYIREADIKELIK